MNDFTRWLMIMAARAEATAACKRAWRYHYRYQSVPPLSYLIKPGNQFGFRRLSWAFMGQNKGSLLVRIQDELSYLLYEQHVRTAEGRPLPIRVRATAKGWGWYVHSC